MKIYRAKINGGSDCSFWLNLKCQDLGDAVKRFRNHCNELDSVGGWTGHYYTELHYLDEVDPVQEYKEFVESWERAQI